MVTHLLRLLDLDHRESFQTNNFCRFLLVSLRNIWGTLQQFDCFYLISWGVSIRWPIRGFKEFLRNRVELSGGSIWAQVLEVNNRMWVKRFYVELGWWQKKVVRCCVALFFRLDNFLLIILFWFGLIKSIASPKYWPLLQIWGLDDNTTAYFGLAGHG